MDKRQLPELKTIHTPNRRLIARVAKITKKERKQIRWRDSHGDKREEIKVKRDKVMRRGG